MEKKDKPAWSMPVLIVLMVLGSFTSCRDFFSTSLFPGAGRDPADLVPPVTPGNVDELIKRAENNPDFALAVLQGIKDTLGKGGSQDDKDRLLAAALKAAANASAIGSSMLNTVGKIPESINQDKVIELVDNTIKTMPNLSAASSILLTLVPDSTEDKNAFDSFIRATKADDLAIASIILVAAEIKGQGGDINHYVQTLDPLGPRSSLEKTALEFAGAAIKKTGLNKPNGFIEDILRGLNLI
ncbi:MAG: hypothetical protein LBT93_02580 [Treponema sp.]|jgi:hypothetical protein|nr:hypothetical protein [Treponema sp.]